MKILIDSLILIWAMELDPKLKTKHKQLIEDSDNTIYVSSVSVFELNLKVAKGHLSFTKNFNQILSQYDFILLPF